jgi:hypothetical protein
MAERQGQFLYLKYPLEYKSWNGLRERCHNKKHRKYPRYGGRGIEVCERWNKFENFIADMGRKPSAEYTLDRIDLNGNYEPSNCRWTTQKTQANNRSTNHPITINGITRNILEWAQEKGINHQTISQRIHVYGWSPEKAVTKPVQSRTRKV